MFFSTGVAVGAGPGPGCRAQREDHEGKTCTLIFKNMHRIMNKDCLHRMEVATMMSTTGFDFHILKPQPSCVYVVYQIQKWLNLDESRV